LADPADIKGHVLVRSQDSGQRLSFPRFQVSTAPSECRSFSQWHLQWATELTAPGSGQPNPEPAKAVIDQRRIVLASAFEAHPERFVSGLPTPTPLPEAAWINKPKRESQQIILGEKNSDSAGSEFEPGGDSGSDVVSQADFSSRLNRPTGKDIKFDSEVSHNH